MRRKALPTHRKSLARSKKAARRAYVISGRAQDVLVAIVEGILEESLEDAQKLAGINGKSCVSREEMEKALINLCLRLNPLSSLANKLHVEGLAPADQPVFLGKGDGDQQDLHDDRASDKTLQPDKSPEKR